MATPTLINLPPAPSDPATPSEMGPGTPNSGTTSLSALSTTAIKDGHKGAAPPHTHHRSASGASGSSTNTLDAERADRISRLAGMERVAPGRHGQQSQHPLQQQMAQASAPPPATAAGAAAAAYPPGYFDAAQLAKERSTVGSASATTGSASGRAPWASGSDDAFALDADKMSDDRSAASTPSLMSGADDPGLVGFGEAAGGSGSTVHTPMQGVERVQARQIDGLAFDAAGGDAAAAPPRERDD